MNTRFQKTSASDEWYTPKEIIQALGVFDLDPCAPMKPIWDTAARMIDKEENGLDSEWDGARVWCNPPYSQPLLTQFCEKFIENGNGILLIFARTDNKMFQYLMKRCDAVLFMRRRIRFFLPDGTRGGSAGCGSALFAIGPQSVAALEQSGIEGIIVNL